MSHRTNWKVLSPTDPIPGDVPGIRDAAEHYKKINQALITARQSLETIINGKLDNAMVSQAVDKIRDNARTVKNSIQGVSERYSVVANELSTYATALDRAQTQADEAERDAQNAQNTIDEAQQRINTYGPKVDGLTRTQQKYASYSGDPDEAPDPKVVSANLTDLRRYNLLLSDANGDKANAERAKQNAADKLQRAINDRNTAASDAARNIRRQINGDNLNDNWLKDLSNAIAHFLESIATGFVDAIAGIVQGLIDLGAGLIDSLKALNDLLSGKISAQEFNDRMNKAFEKCLNALSSIAESISSVCGFVSLILAFIPGAQGIAAIVGTIGKIATFTHLALEGALALKEGMKDGNWDRMARFGIAAVAEAVSLGVGKGLQHAADKTYWGSVIQNAHKEIKTAGGITPKIFSQVTTLHNVIYGTEATGKFLTKQVLKEGKKDVESSLGIYTPPKITQAFNPYISLLLPTAPFFNPVMTEIVKPCINFIVPSFTLPSMLLPGVPHR